MISFDDSINNAIKTFINNNSNVKLTIGTIYQGKKEFAIYDYNGLTNDNNIYFYEIGSLTQTFTSLLIAKAITDKKLNLTDRINKLITVNTKNKIYPTIKQLLTHTSGYPTDIKMNKVFGKMFFKNMDKDNPYKHITNKDIENKLNKTTIKDKTYNYKYSNFGYAVLGKVLESIYQKPFKNLIEDFIKDNLHLYKTSYDQTEDATLYLKGYTNNNQKGANWKWSDDSLYLASSGLISNINDLMEYSFMIMTNTFKYTKLTKEKIIKIDEVSNMSCGWYLIIGDSMMSHNGNTGCFDTSILLSPSLRTAVIVMANHQDASKKSLTTETISYKIMNKMLIEIIEQIKGSESTNENL